MSNWSWFHAALALCWFWLVSYGIYVAIVFWPRSNRLEKPHHSADRNKTEAVP